jgi:translation initiation factor IF-1
LIYNISYDITNVINQIYSFLFFRNNIFTLFMNQNSESTFSSEERTSSQNQRKKQKKLVDVSGIVTHNLSNGKFRVKLENGVQVIAHLSGKIRQNRIKIVVGDTVTVELSPYDLTKGRIVYRHR